MTSMTVIIETQTDAIGDKQALSKRSVMTAMWRGARGRCPNCGEGQIFRAYIKVADTCNVCGEELHHHQADDAPPYFTIFIAGHFVVPLMLAVETTFAPALWVHLAVFIPFTTALCMALLPVCKGAVVGLQWALYMHGFDPNSEEAAADKLGKAKTAGF